MAVKNKVKRENFKTDETVVVTAHSLNLNNAAEINAEVYFTDNALGFPIARGFKGKSQKPTFAFVFETTARRDTYVLEWLEGLRAQKPKPHTLKVGGVLCASWGYDQTNVDFYKITKLVGKTMIEFSKVGVISDHEDGKAALSMQDHVTPDVTTVEAGIYRRRVSMFGDRPCVGITSCANGYLWDGKPKFRSWYA